MSDIYDISYDVKYTKKLCDKDYFKDIPGDIEDFIFYFYNKNNEDINILE